LGGGKKAHPHRALKIQRDMDKPTGRLRRGGVANTNGLMLDETDEEGTTKVKIALEGGGRSNDRRF